MEATDRRHTTSGIIIGGRDRDWYAHSKCMLAIYQVNCVTSKISSVQIGASGE